MDNRPQILADWVNTPPAVFAHLPIGSQDRMSSFFSVRPAFNPMEIKTLRIEKGGNWSEVGWIDEN